MTIQTELPEVETIRYALDRICHLSLFVKLVNCRFLLKKLSTILSMAQILFKFIRML